MRVEKTAGERPFRRRRFLFARWFCVFSNRRKGLVNAGNKARIIRLFYSADRQMLFSVFHSFFETGEMKINPGQYYRRRPSEITGAFLFFCQQKVKKMISPAVSFTIV